MTCSISLRLFLTLVAQKRPETQIHISSRSCDPSRPGFLRTMAAEVSTLVRACNTHGPCTPGCFKYGPTCRSRYPRDEVPRTHAARGFVELERDHRWCNAHNPWVLLALRSNTDCQFVMSGKTGKALVFYLGSYMTKLVHKVCICLFLAPPISRPVLRRHTTVMR